MKGSIVKRNEKTYLLRVSLGKDSVTGKRLYKTETCHGTKKEAEAQLRVMVAQFEGGTLTQKTGKSFNEFIIEWLATSAKQKLRERTLKDYEGLHRYYLQEGLGRLPLDKLNPLSIQQAYTQLMKERNLSALSIKKVHCVVNGALKQAVRWRMLPHNPATGVEMPKVKRNKVIRSFTLQQALEFLDACRGHRSEAYFHFALQTGARPEEILGLLWEDIDFANGTCRIDRVLVRPTGGAWAFQDPKTAGSRRVITLDRTLMEVLRRHKRAQQVERTGYQEQWKSGPQFVFTSGVGSPLYRTHFVKRVYKPLLKKAGLPTAFRLRDLRHTCATLLLEAGESIKAVSERLGHGDVRLTLNIYAHCLPAMQRAAAERAGDLFTRTARARVQVGWFPSRAYRLDHLVITDKILQPDRVLNEKSVKSPI